MRDDPSGKSDLGSAETIGDEVRGDGDTLAIDSHAGEDAALEATVASDADGDSEADVSPSATIPTKGDSLGRYLVVEPLGAGGMGVVYRCFDPDLQRQVALKLLRPRAGTGSGSGGARARLMREAQAMAQLSHPNILTVYDVGTWGDQVYIAMELVGGTTLDEWLRAEPRSLPDILDVFVQAAEGLQAAHAAELVHRDFKPDNVLVDEDNRVRVMDFGLARHLAEAADETNADRSPASEAPPGESPASALSTPLTQAGALLGTPAYMSPEQFAGSTVDARSDQFGFGVALYEALYQQRPFDGETLGELREAVTTGKILPPPKSRPAPTWAQTVITRALSRDADHRYATMGELIRALHRGRRRRQHIAWTAVLAVILVSTVATVLYFQRKSASSDAERQRASSHARKEQAARAAARKDRDRMARHLNILRTKREALLKELVTEKDELKRQSLACRIAGLEDVIKKPGERITAKEIRRALHRCTPLVKHCYLAALAKHHNVAGTLKVEFRTDRDGKVISVKFPMDTVGVPMMTQCIYSTFAKWHIPTGGGGIKPLHITYPFHFKPKNKKEP